MDVFEFIARRIQHILLPYFQKVRFMGIYSHWPELAEWNKYQGQHEEKVLDNKNNKIKLFVSNFLVIITNILRTNY